MDSKLYIIIPVYNVEMYIEYCLESAVNQSYGDYEIIIVDDGSKDSSGEICDRYAALYANITVIHKRNAGLISARLTGVRYVIENRQWQESYCLFLDSDDLLKLNALEIINDNIRKSSCDMLIYGYETFLKDKIIYDTNREQQLPCVINDKAEMFRKAIIEHTYNSMCRKAVRTELLPKYDELKDVLNISMGEDLIQSALLYSRCDCVSIIDNILYCYRYNDNSITHSNNIKKYIDDLSSREFAISVIKEKCLWTQKDFSNYRAKCLDVITNHVKQILNNSNARNIALINLEKLRSHRFLNDFCLENTTSLYNAVLFLFSKKYFNILWILWKINKVKNVLLGR